MDKKEQNIKIRRRRKVIKSLKRMIRTKLVERITQGNMVKANQRARRRKGRIRRKTRAGKESKNLYQPTCFITTIEDQS